MGAHHHHPHVGHTHHHDHAHEHHHHHADIKGLRIAIILTGTVFIAQVIGGIISNSLALLSDAGHVLIDLASLLIAFIGLRIAAKRANSEQRYYTYGFRRIEILAALTNGFLLLGICLFIIIEAVKRLLWDAGHVHADSMLWVAVIGFIANAISAWYLHGREHIATRSAYLHVMTDLMSSGGVIIAAVALKFTDWEWIDPVMSLAIAAIIIRGAIRVIREASVILMETAPKHIDPEEVRNKVIGMDGITSVHDVHIWQLGHNQFTATLHVVTTNPNNDVVRDVQEMMRTTYGIDHVTVQVESEEMNDCAGCG